MQEKEKEKEKMGRQPRQSGTGKERGARRVGGIEKRIGTEHPSFVLPSAFSKEKNNKGAWVFHSKTLVQRTLHLTGYYYGGAVWSLWVRATPLACCCPWLKSKVQRGKVLNGVREGP